MTTLGNHPRTPQKSLYGDTRRQESLSLIERGGAQ